MFIKHNIFGLVYVCLSCKWYLFPFKMAAISVRGEFVLLSNGKTAAVINFRSPGELQLLDLPQLGSTAQVKTQLDNTKNQDLQLKEKHVGEKCSDQEEIKGQEKKQGDSDHGCREKSENSTKSENRILACVMSSDGQFIALCDDRKYLHVYKLNDQHFRLQFSRGVTHRSTSVKFTKNNEQVIVADKSGEVYAFQVQDDSAAQQTRTESNSSVIRDIVSGVETTSIETQAGNITGVGSLLLGHHSMLIDLLMIDNDKLILTSDRDEKIRISHFPDAYNIQAFCLGHTKFVVTLAYDVNRNVILSGSGDNTVRLWTTNGQELYQRNVLPDLPIEQSSLASPEDNTQQTQPHDHSQVSIQQICFSSELSILCVAMYRCPYILVYKLSETLPSGQLTLQLVSVQGKGQGNVASMDIKYNVLWVLRQGRSQLEVSALRILCEQDCVQLEEITQETSSEFMAIKAFSEQTKLIEVTSSNEDIIVSLWKPSFQGNAMYKTSHKRYTEHLEKATKGKRNKR